MTNEEIKAMIEQGLPGAEVHIDGDGTHFYAKVISDAFAGLPLIKQHRLVYATLGEKMGGAIHALSMQTYTQEEWARQQPFQTL
jgi:acid stress-induced BolA-like protein IbaG/YrbA